MAYLYLAKQVGLAAAFAVWAYVVAKGLFANSPLRLSRTEEVALLVPVGLGVAILLLFGLGLAGTLTGTGILTGAGLMLAFSCCRLRGRIASGVYAAARAIASRRATAGIVMIAVAGTVLVPVALNALTPPYMSDEVRYHLPYALHFVEQGRIVPDLYLRYPFHTLNVNLLYAAALIFGDDVTLHYIHLLLGCLAGLALYVLAVSKCGRLIAFCAVLLFFVTPTFRLFAPTAFVDLGLAAFVTSTVACLDRARGRSALVVCAGLAFGAALGTKYLALALFPLVVAWAAYRTRDGRETARFTAVAVLVGAPWYIYNLIWTGNPISPFAGDWFGSWPWTAEDLAEQTRELTQWGRSHSLSNLVLLPYDLVFESHWYRVQSVPVPLAIGLMSLVLLPWWRPKMRPYGIFVLVVVTAWYFTASIFRYLAAILPVWCFISVWSVERTLWYAVSRATRRQITPVVARRHVSYAAVGIVLVFAGHDVWSYQRWLDATAITERVVHRDRFLRKRVPVYGVAEHLRRTGARDEVIFAFPPGALFSYASGNRVVGDYFGPMASRQLGFSSLCPERMIEQLRLKGVSLLVLSQTFLDNRSTLNAYATSRLASEYRDRHAAVFRIESSNESPHGIPQQDSTVSLHGHVADRGDDIHVVPYFPDTPEGFQQGLVRIVNHSDEAGEVVIHGMDDTGTRYGPATLALGARRSEMFGSGAWTACGFAKKAFGNPGENDAGSWWLSLSTDLDIEALGYTRTVDRALTPMHGIAKTTRGPDGRTMHHVPFFDPGNESSPTSHLRLVNPGDRTVAVTITGRDDAGEAASEEVRLSLRGGTACWLNAVELESGESDNDGSGCDIISGRLGNGQGRWRLSVAAAGGDILVMSVLSSPTGHLTNLSGTDGIKSGAYTLPIFLPVSDSDAEPHGLVRIVNHSERTGTVEIRGIDDTGASHGPVTLAIGGQEAVHLDSGDLESGNTSKGLPEGLGDGDGYWRLRLATELNIEALAFVRTRDAFVTSVHEVARTAPAGEDETVHYIPTFNPGRNTRQVSWLRLSNLGRRDVEVTIEGRDRTGFEAPEGVVRLTLPARQACMLSARTLESGKPEPGSNTCTGEQFDFKGRFGQASGKWSLFVTTKGDDVQVMSLLRSPDGYMTNLSTTNRVPTGRPAIGKRLDFLPDGTIARVERWGPRSARLGEPFNVQPSGNSALWFVFQELDRDVDYKIYIGSQPLLTYVAVERGLVTASLTPKHSRQFESTQGKIPIHLVDPGRGKQLIGHFVVTGGDDAGKTDR